MEGDTEQKLLQLEGQEFKKVEQNRYPVPANAVAWVSTGSGGGWGDPLDRDPARVQWDVIEELVSEKSARENYGVVLGKDQSIDAAATVALRAKLRGAPRPSHAV